jgi:hypothetical protein
LFTGPCERSYKTYWLYCFLIKPRKINKAADNRSGLRLIYEGKEVQIVPAGEEN